MIKNLQLAEKQDHSKSGILSVHSIFYTIQGEGPFAGQPAHFIRLAGCNLQCPGCDTDYTSGRSMMSCAEILLRMKPHYSASFLPLVVITGGEPFRQNIAPLVNDLISKGYRVQIETNGTLYCDLNYTAFGNRLTIVCSPKAGAVNKRLLPYINAYKYVMEHSSVAADGLPYKALQHPAEPIVARPHAGFDGHIYLQPMDAQDKRINWLNQEACIRSCMTHGYILQLQIHKIIGLE